MLQDLKQKINDKNAVIGIIGMGYVGLPLSLAFCSQGFHVVGFDVDQKKCDYINNAETYIKHIPAKHYKDYSEKKLLRGTSDFTELKDVDVILICVPTPLNENREPDLSFVESTAHDIGKYGRKGQLVILESSTYPGTTQEIIGDHLTEKGFKINEDLFLAYSPEREDPSNPNFSTSTIPKVVGADNDDVLDVSVDLYAQIIDEVVPVKGTRTAEAVKLTENIFRSVNIAMVNEMKVIYEKMGIDVWDVIDAAATKPFGYMPFYPGPGLGGHCIPIDPFYLTWKAKQYDIDTRFIELAGEINTFMPHYVIKKIEDAVGGVADKKILILGIAYKGNLDDDRESPAYTIIDLLENENAQVDFYDPHIPILKGTRKFPENKGRESIDFTAENIACYDACVIVTAHDAVDWALLNDNAKIIIDTRNAMKGLPSSKVVKA